MEKQKEEIAKYGEEIVKYGEYTVIREYTNKITKEELLRKIVTYYLNCKK